MTKEKSHLEHYEVSFVCANCNYAFYKDIPKGEPIPTKKIMCPNCGTQSAEKSSIQMIQQIRW